MKANEIREVDAELTRLRAENERLKALNLRLALSEGKFRDACIDKDAALDRLEWAGDDRIHNTCFACDVIEGEEHKPDCWHQAARSAGREK